MQSRLEYIATVDDVLAPHPVRDWAKVRRIIRAARRGDDVPGWVESVHPTSGCYEALSGSHRMAAVAVSRLLGREIDITPRVVEWTDTIQDALECGDYDILQDSYNE